MYEVTFAVKGRGKFPIDMLRLDCCFPASLSDAQTISCAGFQDPREVTLTKHVSMKPNAYSLQLLVTPARWEEYGWLVSDIQTTTRKVRAK